MDTDAQPVPATPPRRRRGRRIVVAAMVTAAVAVAGTATAWALGRDGSANGAPSGAPTGAAGHGGGDGSDDAEGGDHGGGDHEAPAMDTEMPGERHGHHPSLPPYEERQAAASDAERAAAGALRDDVRSTLAAYADPAAAEAAGYRPPPNPRRPIRHYLRPGAVRDGEVLDPQDPEGLVYLVPDAGDPVLLGAFFVAPRGAEAPRPAGELVVWHSHDPACPGFHATEEEDCTGSRRMLHVWTVDEVELPARSGRTVPVEVTDPFGAPLRSAVAVRR